MTIPTLTSHVLPKEMKPDIVVMGGGPIGLWTAIQTKMRTGKEVVVLEKYQNYMRSDIRLNIDASSFDGAAKDAELNALIKGWSAAPIPIKTLEESLAKRAHELGIQTIKGYKAEPSALPKLFPSAKIFIGADGARSAVRHEIFGDAMKFDTKLQYMAQVHYTVKPPKNDLVQDDPYFRRIKDGIRSYSMQKFAGHFIVQNTHPQEDGSLKISLNIFIDKTTYEQTIDATFKNPYYFEQDLAKTPSTLKELLIKWWGAKKLFYDEEISLEEPGLNKLTVVALNSYAAQEVVKVTENGKTWALVGDAAQAHPFFRAVNNGFLLGSRLATSLKNDTTSSLQSYNRYATIRAYIERVRAVAKSVFISLYSLYLKIISKLPWRGAIQLGQAQEDRCYRQGLILWKKIEKLAPTPVFV